MVRGNWQRRVELNDARRAAAKAQKEERRSRQQQRSGGDPSCAAPTSSADRGAAFARLDAWLVREGDRIGVGDWSPGDDGSGDGGDGDEAEPTLTARVDVDVWTDRPPGGRDEYLPPLPPEEEDDPCGSDDEDTRRKKKGGRRPTGKKAKGRSHPNANVKEPSSSGKSSKGRDRSDSTAATIRRNLCPDEFYGGKEPRRHHAKGKRGGGKSNRRDRSGSSAGADEDDAGGTDGAVQYYADLPRARGGRANNVRPMTLYQCLGGRYSPHLSSLAEDGGGRPAVSLPVRAREASLAACRDAADGTGMLVPLEGCGGEQTDGGSGKETSRR